MIYFYCKRETDRQTDRQSRERCRREGSNLQLLLLPDDNIIFLTAEPFSAQHSLVVHHHIDPGCPAEKLVCYLQGQGHIEGWADQNMTCSSTIIVLLNGWSFCHHVYVARWYIIISSRVLWKRSDCRVQLQGQGHSKGSNLHWMFVSPIFSVPLDSWQTMCVDALLQITGDRKREIERERGGRGGGHNNILTKIIFKLAAILLSVSCMLYICATSSQIEFPLANKDEPRPSPSKTLFQWNRSVGDLTWLSKHSGACLQTTNT